MAANIKAPVFKTGPKDIIPVADTYNDAVEQLGDAAKDVLSDTQADFADAIADAFNDAIDSASSDLPDVVVDQAYKLVEYLTKEQIGRLVIASQNTTNDMVNEIIGTNTDTTDISAAMGVTLAVRELIPTKTALNKRLRDSFGSSATTSSMSQSMQDDLADNVADNVSDVVYKTTEDTLVKTNENVSYDDIQKLNVQLTALDPEHTQPEVDDTLIKNAYTESLISEAGRLGMPGVIDSVIDKVETRTGPIQAPTDPAYRDEVNRLKKTLIDTLEQAKANGDMALAKTIVARVGNQMVQAHTAELIRSLLANYTTDPITELTSPSQAYDKLISDLKAIDPQWMTNYRNGVAIVDLTPFGYANERAQAILLFQEPTQTPMRIAKAYPDNTQQLIAKHHYPFTF